MCNVKFIEVILFIFGIFCVLLFLLKKRHYIFLYLNYLHTKTQFRKNWYKIYNAFIWFSFQYTNFERKETFMKMCYIDLWPTFYKTVTTYHSYDKWNRKDHSMTFLKIYNIGICFIGALNSLKCGPGCSP